MARKSTTAAKGLGKTLKVKKSDGRTSNYSKESCHGTKTDAKKKAESIRNGGGTARVLQDPATKKHCVFKGPKAKKSAVSGPRKRKRRAKK